MGIRVNYRGAPAHGFAFMILSVFAFSQIACAEENTQNQASANAAGPAPESVGNEKAAVVAQAGDEHKESTPSTSALYSVECGQVNDAGEAFCLVDRDTYIGWRTFHGFCHRCHAQDALGSTFAPSLVDRMQELEFDIFVDRMANGYTGPVGVMPPWKDNPNVSKRYKELFAYLKARSDGALPPGRPKKKP